MRVGRFQLHQQKVYNILKMSVQNMLKDWKTYSNNSAAQTLIATLRRSYVRVSFVRGRRDSACTLGWAPNKMPQRFILYVPLLFVNIL